MTIFLIIINYGINASENIELYHDTQILTEKLINYMENHCKDFKFINFYEKQFIDNFKSLIKDENKFKKFLNEINFDLNEFFNISVYVCPHCFTTNLIKFIKLHYITKKLS